MKGNDLKPEGCLLEDCPDIPKARIPVLKSLGIKTVEELANLHDRSLQNIGMDARVLQMAAKTFLEENNEAKRLADRVAELEAKLEAAEKNGDSKDDTAKRSSNSRDKST